MAKEIEIPEGYEAKIENNKVIFVPKESEGERIRKAIGAAICGTTAISILEANGTNLSDALAYLEKQKEPHYTKRNALFDKCVENCDTEVMKRVSDKIDEMLEKEQKSVTLDESVELGLDRALHIIKDAKGNLPAYQTDDGIYECDNAIRALENLLKNGIEQKPTPGWMPKFLDELRCQKNYFDWDEHRDIEGHILAIINWIAPDYFDRKEKRQNLIMANSPQLKEQQPAEWSKEDEKCIQDIINCLEYLKREDTERQYNGDQSVNPGRYTDMIAKLLSLCPQPKEEWTINNAKPGDILHTSSTASSKTFIFKGIRDDEHGTVECFCCYDSEDGFLKGEEQLIGWKTDKYRLATPEQCIKLGRIMGKAGYIFYFETNQLRKLN